MTKSELKAKRAELIKQRNRIDALLETTGDRETIRRGIEVERMIENIDLELAGWGPRFSGSMVALADSLIAAGVTDCDFVMTGSGVSVTAPAALPLGRLSR